MWRPGKSSIPLVAETNQQLDRAPPDRQTGSKKRAAGGDGSPVGLRPPFDPSPPELSHPDCRWLLTLIVAAQGAKQRQQQGWSSQAERAGHDHLASRIDQLLPWNWRTARDQPHPRAA